MKFSVVMSVYRNDKTEYVVKAIESITVKQTRCPDEIVLVVDGPISGQLDAIVEKLECQLKNCRIIRLPQNVGHARARQVGVLACNSSLVAIMDADDISLPNRFEKQLKYFEQNENLSCVGGQILEFINSVSNIVGRRVVPQVHSEICKYMKSRCPFNQMTVMFRKRDVLKAGNYMDWYCDEDYYLWIRMMLAGCRFANLPDTLVNVRVGKDMYARRGGWRYFKSEAALQKYMLANKVISPFRYLFNVSIRFVVQVMMPNRIRGFVFRRMLRTNR